MSTPPRLVATIGMRASASTFMFNVVRDIMATALRPGAVAGVYAKDTTTLLAGVLKARHVVVKSHHGGVGLELLIRLARAPVFVSIRDPRDAVVSTMQRFGLTLPDAVRDVARDCRIAIRYADAGHLLWRYEDRFFEDAALPGRLAEALGIALDHGALSAIGARYGTAAVRDFIAGFANLPAGRVFTDGSDQVDLLTQIHQNHISDGRTGKWRGFFSPDTGRTLTRSFAPFLARFDYNA